MTYLGDFRTGKTVRKMWNSNAVAGGSITRATNGTISVYKDGGTTQSTTGVTDTEDFDSLTGVHLVAIDTSADGTFYSAGSDFEAVLSAATIDGVTINATLFSFSLENRSHLMPTTDGRKLDVSAGGEAGVDWANVGSPTTAVNLSATNIDVDQVVASVSGAVASVGAGGITAASFAANAITAAKLDPDVTTELQSGLATAAALDTVDNFLDTEIAAIITLLGTPAVDISADIAAVKVDTAAILVDTGTTLDGKIDTIDDFLDTEIAAIKAKTDSLTFTVAAKVDANVLAVDGDTNAPTRLKRGLLTTVLLTCDTGGTTTSVVASSLTATAVNDQFIGRLIVFDTGTTTAALRGQATDITDYDHASQTFTVTALTTAPASGDTGVIV